MKISFIFFVTLVSFAASAQSATGSASGKVNGRLLLNYPLENITTDPPAFTFGARFLFQAKLDILLEQKRTREKHAHYRNPKQPFRPDPIRPRESVVDETIVSDEMPIYSYRKHRDANTYPKYRDANTYINAKTCGDEFIGDLRKTVTHYRSQKVHCAR